jgi:hypothetical protein
MNKLILNIETEIKNKTRSKTKQNQMQLCNDGNTPASKDPIHWLWSFHEFRFPNCSIGEGSGTYYVCKLSIII